MKKQLITLYEQIITESDEQELKAAFDVLEKDIDQAVRNAKSDVSEEVSSIIGLVLSGPFIVKLFGKFIKYIEKKIAQFKREDPTQVGEKILNFAEKFHHIVMIPFEKLSKLLVKDQAKQKKLANYLFHGTIGILLLHGGYKLASKLTSDVINVNLALDLAKNGIKGAELTTGMKEIIKSSLIKVGEDVSQYN